ncbi:serpin-ZX-like [Lotus japonicus]|uniref:serpin-ZX-like n=1 Tax=Lotus japonicus TaxID=34305 RepID=UPI00258C1551|nr:serpin-ZX-like [Lotus japonicus]XP_057446803.1 serpin-ZX-like [Lotus japonicus]XP_057446804.1 serpin-ZX-like [Lotus japonicus]
MEIQKSKSTRCQSDVALSFTKHLFSKEDYQEKNLIFSPLSLYAALSVMAAGSEGRTLDELLSFLRFDSIDHLNTYFSQGISPVFSDEDPASSPSQHHLSFTNGMFIDTTVSLSYPFRRLLSTHYNASLASLDFNLRGDSVLHDVNSLIEQESNGLITQLLPPGTVTNLTKLIFANALRFQGMWKHTLDGLTHVSSFNLLSGTSVKVPYMTTFKKTQYVRAFDGFKILRLPYKQGRDRQRRFSMCIFLPDAQDGLSALIQKLSSEPGFLKGKLPHRKVRVRPFRVPKFNISFTFEASNVLKEVGVVSPFSPMDAHFTKMVNVNSPSDNLFVQSIFHKAFIEVNEKGTKATAATWSALARQCARDHHPSIDFIADHPFLFLIREDFTGTILFVGQVLNPLDGLPVKRTRRLCISPVAARPVKDRRVTPLSKDENSMFLGLSREYQPSPRLPSSALFPEISLVDCRFDVCGCEGWKA